MIKLLDVTDEHIRRRQLMGVVTSMALLASGVGAFMSGGSPWIAAPAIALGTVFVVLAGSLRQRWEIAYKGHEIRFENSPYTGERLYLDGGRVARGGVGLKMEMRAPIRVGEGVGEEIVALIDAGALRFRLRLFVDGADAAPVAAVSTPVPAVGEPTRSGVIGTLVVARQVVELLSGLITIAGALGTVIVWLLR